MNDKRKAVALVIVGALALVFLLLAATGAWAGPDEYVLAGPLAPADVVSNTLSYQGRLLDAGGEPLDGTTEMTFRLYDVPSGGTALWTQVQNVEVERGLFNAYLDVDTALFNGQALWLGVQVAGDAQELAPRQPLLPAPYALALPGLWTQQNATSPNLIGGYGGNSVAPGVVGAVIGGGGDSVYPNWVSDDYGTVGGGVGNTAGSTGDGADYATVGGGAYNAVSGEYGTIAGGDGNLAAANHTAIGGGLVNWALAPFSTVGGGGNNEASGWYATVGGGEGNVASGTHATVGGGESNVASGANATVGGGGYNNYATAAGSTVGGGFGNDATGAWSTVGGGKDNVASGDFATVGGGDVNCATGAWSTVGGGSWNTASGDYSFAAGREAWTNHGGSFVWSSGESTSSWYTNTFTVRAHGGVRFYSAPGTSVGVQLWSGTSAWGFISDRNVKENFADVDAARVLETLAAMPIQTWNLKTQSPDMRHVGPVAQDFNGEFAYLFGKVESPTHINSADAIGVALVAIQGLYAQNDSLRAKSIELAAENSELRQWVEALETENAAQQAQLDDMEARLAALEAAGGTSQTSGLQIPGGWWALGGLVIVAAVVGQRRLGGGR